MQKKDTFKLEKVQKRFTKMIEGLNKKTYEQRICKLGITTLEDRHYRADMLQVYKILNDGKNMYPDKFLELNIRAGRKNSLKLFKRRTDRDIYKYSFTPRVVTLVTLVATKSRLRLPRRHNRGKSITLI